MEKANRSRIFVAALGFSLTWIFLQPSTLPWPEQLGEGGFSDTWYGILLGAFIALSIVVIAGRRYVERFIEGHRVILFVLMMLSLAGFALLQSAGSFGSAELIACCAASLLAVGYLAIIMAWICGIATLGGAGGCPLGRASRADPIRVHCDGGRSFCRRQLRSGCFRCFMACVSCAGGRGS